MNVRPLVLIGIEDLLERTTIKDKLQKHYYIRSVARGIDIISSLAQEEFDLVILDTKIHTPDLCATLYGLSKLNPKQKVIVLKDTEGTNLPKCDCVKHWLDKDTKNTILEGLVYATINDI